ncbi:MAG: cupredoxin domain-containing protein [Candidatus Acidiferrales bacterium]
MKILRFLASAAFLACFALPVCAQQAPSAQKPVQEIQMTAKDFEFDPPIIHVKVGTSVKLIVTSADRTHGIRINLFPDGAAGNTPPGLEFVFGQDCFKLKKNDPVAIEFIAHDAGTYSLTCCKLCGTGHKRMKGQIIVDPS